MDITLKILFSHDNNINGYINLKINDLELLSEEFTKNKNMKNIISKFNLNDIKLILVD